mgnify:CR=1 FL=1
MFWWLQLECNKVKTLAIVVVYLSFLLPNQILWMIWVDAGEILGFEERALLKGGRAGHYLVKTPAKIRGNCWSGRTLGANPKLTSDRNKSGHIWVESRMHFKAPTYGPLQLPISSHALHFRRCFNKQICSLVMYEHGVKSCKQSGQNSV